MENGYISNLVPCDSSCNLGASGSPRKRAHLGKIKGRKGFVDDVWDKFCRSRLRSVALSRIMLELHAFVVLTPVVSVLAYQDLSASDMAETTDERHA
jgi:hypothetical protein